MRVVLLCLLLALLGGGAWQVRRYLSAHFAVALNGKPVVALATQAQCAQAILKLKASYAPNVPEIVQFAQGDLTIIRLQKVALAQSVPAAVNALRALKLQVQMNGYAIIVDGNPLVLLASKEDAVETLAIMEEQALGDKDGLPTFAQRIVVDVYRQQVGGKRPLLPTMTPQQAADELTHPPRPNFATVGRGDSLYTVGNRHKLTVDQMKALNPTVDPMKLQPGDQLRLPDTLAPITVVVKS